MSLVQSSQVSEPSYQFSKEISGKINPRVPVRLMFPGGWNNKDSEIFGWYDSQPYKLFRTIRYYKEPQGVGHEFIILPLKATSGTATGWFCRLERMAHPDQQLAAIGTEGTEAYDYIRSFESTQPSGPIQPSDSIQPSENTTPGTSQDAGLIAEITLPRDFDLYDILAICSAIAEHPQTHRYTLQQYNCYFFSWAIILLLARQASSWEKLVLPRTNEIMGSILTSVAAPIPTENAKVAHILSAAHTSNTDPTRHLLKGALESSAISTLDFFRTANAPVGSVLWFHRGRSALKDALGLYSMELAYPTVDLLIEADIDITASSTTKPSEDVDDEPGLEVQEQALKGLAIFDREFRNIAVAFLGGENPALISEYKGNRVRKTPGQPLDLTATSPHTMGHSARLLNAACKSLSAGIGYATATAKLHNQIAIRQNQNKGVRMLKYVGNTIRHLPSSLRIYSKLTRLLTETREGKNGLPARERCALYAFDFTIAKLLRGLPGRDAKVLRAVVLQLMLSVSEGLKFKVVANLYQFWRDILWDFVGDIIAGAILEVVLAEKGFQIGFECLQPPKVIELLGSKLGLEVSPIIRLQQFIEERIVRLSKHDIDHAPIIKYIPLPAMAPPVKSQEQIKDTLEEIWRSANEGKRFRVLENEDPRFNTIWLE